MTGPLLIGGGDVAGAADLGDDIEFGCRFDAASTAYLSNAAHSGTSRRIWTCSFWFKPTILGTNREIVEQGADNNNDTQIRMSSDDQLFIHADDGGANVFSYKTNMVFRDTSSWYHIVVAVDTSAAIAAANKVRLYVNGVEVTSWKTETNPSNDVDTEFFNGTEAMVIGRRNWNTDTYLDGYLAQFYMINNQQLDATSFGHFSTTHPDVWVPDDFSGSYGTGGFALEFDTAPGTGAGAGDDTSGNGDDFTENNFSATYPSDQVLDTPTENYPVAFNAACPDYGDGTTPTEGGMKEVVTGESNIGIWAFGALSTGKYFYQWDFTDNASAGNCRHGMNPLSGWNGASNTVNATDSFSADHRNDYWRFGSTTEDAGNPGATGRYACAFDLDAGKAWFGLVNTGDGTITWYDDASGEAGDPANGNNPTGTFTANTPLVYWSTIGMATGTSWTLYMDFGQFGFDNSVVPSGFLAINTKTMTAPTIEIPTDYFEAIAYSGDGSDPQAITGLNAGFTPNLVAIKNRDTTDGLVVNDSVRGVGTELRVDTTAVEAANADGVTAFSDGGFSCGDDLEYNTSGEAYVAWCFKELSTFFDIVLYTGNNTDPTEIAHSLDTAPTMMIVKERTNDVGGWFVYHKDNTAAPETDYLYLDTTAATVDDATVWSDSAPSASVFTIGNHDDINESSGTYVAYLFTDVTGLCYTGTYEGNAAADGPFVYCGFRPAFVMCKSIDSTSNWHIYDNKREGYNADNDRIDADTAAAEGTADEINMLANGFKVVIATDPNIAETYIYIAIAETPFGGGSTDSEAQFPPANAR